MIPAALPLRIFLAMLFGLLALSGPMRAEAPVVSAPEGLALGGYDAVAYFTEGAPVPGRPEHALRWRGAVWLFSGAETLLAFEMNPRAYAPRFGGYCAVALSEGRLAPGDPLVFAIVDGRLYLAHSRDLLDLWRKDGPARIEAAQAHWPAILGR